MIPWAPTIYLERCIGCGDCRDFCPNDVFLLDEVDQKMHVASSNNCVPTCDRCVTSCPNEAISFPDKEEMKKLLQQLRQQIQARPLAQIQVNPQ
ncbi:MAG: 4Fe-4S dicluster domain-containing protein [Bryobacteraceae bacterium]|jgi:NAD-dependent dihydropyrimidine dehydrogenase PreA subunit